MCPECGAKPEKTGQNLTTGDVVYTCAAGHQWVSGEVKAAPASPGMVEEEPKPHDRKSGERPGGEGAAPA